MTLTDRDRKIVLVLVPIVCVIAFWMLLLSPKREEAAKAGEDLTALQEERDAAVLQADQLQATKSNFAEEYAELVRLGKAVPTSVDMPSLIVQLDAAARGTGIRFDRIAPGPRQAAPVAAGTTPSGDPVAAGGEPAASGPGQATEQANQAAADSDAANADLDTSTSTPATPGGGGIPIGGGTAPIAGATPGLGAPGLDSVPLELQFTGDFFDLASFFHRLKRFVKVSNERLEVSGRLMTVDNLSLGTEEDLPAGILSVDVTATIYLAPTSPAATAAGAGGTTTTAGDTAGSSPITPPTAAVTP